MKPMDTGIKARTILLLAADIFLLINNIIYTRMLSTKKSRKRLFCCFLFFVPIQNFPIGRRIAQIDDIQRNTPLERRFVRHQAGDIKARRLPDIAGRKLAGLIGAAEIIHHKLMGAVVTVCLTHKFFRQTTGGLGGSGSLGPLKAVGIGKFLDRFRVVLIQRIGDRLRLQFAGNILHNDLALVFGIPSRQMMTGDRKFITTLRAIELIDIGFGAMPTKATILADAGDAAVGKLHQHCFVGERIAIIVLTVGTVDIGAGAALKTHPDDALGVDTGHGARHHVIVTLPYSKGGMVDTLHSSAQVLNVEYTAEGIEVETIVDPILYGRLKEFVTKEC